MSDVWRFLHYLSFIASASLLGPILLRGRQFDLVFGGALAAMVAGITMRKVDRSLWSGIAEAQGGIYRTMVGPGAMVSVLSGIMMTFAMYGQLSASVGAWLGMMQGVGIAAALVTLLAAARVARIDPAGERAAAFDAARTRLAITGSIGGLLALIALLAGALYR